MSSQFPVPNSAGGTWRGVALAALVGWASACANRTAIHPRTPASVDAVPARVTVNREPGTGNQSASGVSHISVRMRDGVVLRGYLMLPPGPGPFPVIVYRTPYGVK